jgi:SAM-dependent methyltransferase
LRTPLTRGQIAVVDDAANSHGPDDPDGTVPNADQADYWNGPEGQHWVEHEARFDGMLEPFVAPILDAAGVGPGVRLLDVGCGNGALTRAATTRGAEATGLDISGPMVERARAHAAAEGLAVEFLEADAQAHRFSGGFDVVVSRFGVMFFGDPTAAFTNLTRALEPGGRLAFACWQEQARNEWVVVPALAMLPIVGPPDVGPPDAPGPFAFADRDRVEGILDDAGFSDIGFQSVELPLLLGGGLSLDETVSWLSQGGMGKRFLGEADGPTTERALAAVREALAPHVTTDGVRLGSAVWVVTATRG